MMSQRMACGKGLGVRAQTYIFPWRGYIVFTIAQRLKMHLIFLQTPIKVGVMGSY